MRFSDPVSKIWGGRRGFDETLVKVEKAALIMDIDDSKNPRVVLRKHRRWNLKSSVQTIVNELVTILKY